MTNQTKDLDALIDEFVEREVKKLTSDYHNGGEYCEANITIGADLLKPLLVEALGLLECECTPITLGTITGGLREEIISCESCKFKEKIMKMMEGSDE